MAKCATLTRVARYLITTFTRVPRYQVTTLTWVPGFAHDLVPGTTRLLVRIHSTRLMFKVPVNHIGNRAGLWYLHRYVSVGIHFHSYRGRKSESIRTSLGLRDYFETSRAACHNSPSTRHGNQERNVGQALFSFSVAFSFSLPFAFVVPYETL